MKTSPYRNKVGYVYLLQILNRLQSHLSHYQKKREGKSELFRLTDFEAQIVEYILNVESKPLQTENNVSHYFSSSFK